MRYLYDTSAKVIPFFVYVHPNIYANKGSMFRDSKKGIRNNVPNWAVFVRGITYGTQIR